MCVGHCVFVVAREEVHFNVHETVEAQLVSLHEVLVAPVGVLLEIEVGEVRRLVRRARVPPPVMIIMFESCLLMSCAV